MKKILLGLSLFFAFISTSSAEVVALMSFRSVPADEMHTFMKNEEMYWSKVSGKLLKEGKITNWSIHVRQGGYLSTEPNVFTRIEFGSWENLDNVYKNYDEAMAAINAQMPANEYALIAEKLKQDKYEVASVVTNHHATIFAKNADWDYVVLNYSKGNNAAQYAAEEKRLMSPFFEKMINTKGSKMQGWTVSQVLSPTGYDYDANVITGDFYKNMSDIFTAWNDITPPDGVNELAKMKQPGFWRTEIWFRNMYLDKNANVVVRTP
jgi:hypothetical protein